jgi:hypothetical protein
MEINHVIETFGQAFVQLLVVSTKDKCPFFHHTDDLRALDNR